jgi:hypothetical protein
VRVAESDVKVVRSASLKALLLIEQQGFFTLRVTD